MSKQAPDQPCGTPSEVTSVCDGTRCWLHVSTAAAHNCCFLCVKPCPHPNSSAILTNPFLCFTTTVLTPGADARDSAAPPITITTALPFPFLERRWARLDLLTGQRPDWTKFRYGVFKRQSHKPKNGEMAVKSPRFTYHRPLCTPEGLVSWKVLPGPPGWVSHQETPEWSHSFLFRR